jgi:hypothetical protein
MNRSEDEDSHDEDPTFDRVEIDATVREIFDGIFDGPVEQFKERLAFIKENKFGDVWRDDTERHDKVMRHAKTFLQALTASFPSKHAEAAKHIEGSTCDSFLEYVHEKLDESLLGQDPFEDSCKKIKELITSKILGIKGTLEAPLDEQPKQKSDLEVMILQTNLLDSIHIHHALLCCQIAYDCKDPEHNKNSLEKLHKEHLLSELSVSYENKNVPKYVMARCGNVLYVCFNGMQSHNFGSKETSYRGKICTGICFHTYRNYIAECDFDFQNL